MIHISPATPEKSTLRFAQKEVQYRCRLLGVSPTMRDTLPPPLLKNMISNVYKLLQLFRTGLITLEEIVALTPAQRTQIITHVFAITSLAHYIDFTLELFLKAPSRIRLQVITEVETTIGLLELNIPFALILSANLHGNAPQIFRVSKYPSLKAAPLNYRLTIYQHIKGALELLKNTTIEELLDRPHDELTDTLKHYMGILAYLKPGKSVTSAAEQFFKTHISRYKETVCYAYKTVAWEPLGEPHPTFDIPNRGRKKNL